MLKHDSKHGAPLRGVSEKAAYTKAARKMLVTSRSRLDGVRLIVRQAVESGRLNRSAQLDRALEAMEIIFSGAEVQLRILQKSGEIEWEEQRADLEDAWEDLAHSIKHLVARFADADHISKSEDAK